MSARLTPPQRHLLDALHASAETAGPVVGPSRFWTVDEVARMLGTSPQGAVQTAASLVRKGLLVRLPNRRTFYTLPREAVVS